MTLQGLRLRKRKRGQQRIFLITRSSSKTLKCAWNWWRGPRYVSFLWSFGTIFFLISYLATNKPMDLRSRTNEGILLLVWAKSLPELCSNTPKRSSAMARGRGRFTIWTWKNSSETLFCLQRDYFWNLSRAIQLAKKVIYIHGWWLSPGGIL